MSQEQQCDKRGEWAAGMPLEIADSVRGVLQILRNQTGATFAQVRKHCALRGDDLSRWPEWTRTSEGYVTEADAAAMLYQIMQAFTPSHALPKTAIEAISEAKAFFSHHNACPLGMDEVLERIATASAPSTTPQKIEHPGIPCPHGRPHELDGRCATCDCGKPTNSDCCKFVVSMLRGPIRQPALADRVLELIEENAARASATSAIRRSDPTIQLVRQAIFHVLDDREWDFENDEQRVDFADAVATWIPTERT